MAEFFRLLGLYVGVIVLEAAVLVAVRFLTRVPDHIFRKLLHFVAFTSILPLAYGTDRWHTAVLVQAFFLAVVYIALRLAEHLPFYSALFVEKRPHEIITSFLLLFGMIGILLCIFWGGLGPAYKYIAVTAIFAWGPGDAAAAIVGKAIGRHPLSGPHIEGIKSVEGTCAMALTSFCCTLACLLLAGGLPFFPALIRSLFIAPVAALVELFTKNGNDTVTVPIATAIVLTIFTMI